MTKDSDEENRFSDIAGPRSDPICYAGQNRQNGITSLSAQCDLALVVGSRNVGRLDGVTTVGLSSGAGVPGILVEQLPERLGEPRFQDVTVERTSVADVHFSVPRQLAQGRLGDRRTTATAFVSSDPIDRSVT